MTIMTAKLAGVPFGRTDRFYIGGEWVRPSSDAVIEAIAGSSVTTFSASDFSLAFGGFKQSGGGREGGPQRFAAVSRDQDRDPRRAAVTPEIVAGP
jgi:hypothetical protein